MTKEQEEAINNIKVFIRSIRSDLVEESKDNQKLANDIEAVLNMLKEKDKEIAKYEKIYKEYDCYRWVKELEKKDKMINEMIEEYEYNDRINLKNFCNEEIRKDKCIENCTICTKQYFERKAKDGRN